MHVLKNISEAIKGILEEFKWVSYSSNGQLHRSLDVELIKGKKRSHSVLISHSAISVSMSLG